MNLKGAQIGGTPSASAAAAVLPGPGGPAERPCSTSGCGVHAIRCEIQGEVRRGAAGRRRPQAARTVSWSRNPPRRFAMLSRPADQSVGVPRAGTTGAVGHENTGGGHVTGPGG